MHKGILLCIAVLLLSSCASSPRVADYPHSTQQKLGAVSHWQILAQEVVDTQVMSSLAYKQKLYPIYVDDSDKTEFGKAFFTYLITELARRNVIISPTPDRANVLQWSTQVIFHDRWPVGSGIIFETIGAIAWVFTGSSIIAQPPDAEVIITTQVVHRNFLLSSNTYNYYINELDMENFRVGGYKISRASTM